MGATGGTDVPNIGVSSIVTPVLTDRCDCRAKKRSNRLGFIANQARFSVYNNLTGTRRTISASKCMTVNRDDIRQRFVAARDAMIELIVTIE